MTRPFPEDEVKSSPDNFYLVYWLLVELPDSSKYKTTFVMMLVMAKIQFDCRIPVLILVEPGQ